MTEQNNISPEAKPSAPTEAKPSAANTSANNKRIAKNTIALYIRMLFTMAVSLYTSRVILQTLGVEDFGVYNVVGGVVSMLSFFNSSMATSTQRFLNFEMGKGDSLALNKVFINAINSHLFIAIITAIALESVGLWFLYNKLVIPKEQIDAATLVFHCSVISLFISIVNTPYRASIIANEKMGIFAYFSIIEVMLNLLIVYALVVIPYNKLATYGALTMLSTIASSALNFQYCIRHFKECRYVLSIDIGLIKKMLLFSGWMLFGCLSDMLSKQGVNVLLNLFFGPVFNAARGIAIQVNTAVNSFVANFMTAVRPQIIKSYSAGDFSHMYRLVFSSSKMSFYLLFLITTPILLYTEFILQLWLKQVPEYCVLFTRLVLIELLISSAYVPIAQINQASGKIRNYQLAISIIFLVSFVFTYILFKIGCPAYSTFLLSISLAIIGLFVRVLILKHDNSFPAKQYLLKIMLPLLPIATISLIAPILVMLQLKTSFASFLLVTIIGFISSITTIWLLGLDSAEKRMITDRLTALRNKIRKK